MAATEVRVDEFNRRYRLRPTQQSLQPRLNQLTENLLTEQLSPVLEELGVRANEEICIRHLHIDLSFPPTLSDSEQLIAWRAQVAAALHNELSRNDSSRVVRYPSHIDAHIDIAKSLVAGRVQRVWAWRMLGLVGSGSGGGAEGLREVELSWVHRLCSDPNVIPVVHQLAKTGLFGELLTGTRLDIQDLELISRAVLVQADRSEVLALLSSGGFPKVNPTSRSYAAARRIASQVQQQVWADPKTDATPLAALWWLVGSESGLLCQPAVELHETLQNIAALLTNQTVVPEVAHSSDIDGHGESITGEPATTAEVRVARKQPGSESASGADPMLLTPAANEPTYLDSADDVFPNTESARAKEPRVHTEKNGGRDTGSVPLPTDIGAPVIESAPGTSGAGVEDFAAERVQSAYAGLLLLLNLVRHYDFIDYFLATPERQQRPLGWWLEQLGVQLAGLPVDDMALAVFSGREPDEIAWSEREAPITITEQDQVFQCVEMIQCALLELLPTWEAEQILTQVCCRRGSLEVTSGWITVYFDHDSVSTDIRRSALDLNPDFVPWLGVVVRFEYE